MSSPDLALVGPEVSGAGDAIAAWVASALAEYAGTVDALHVASADAGAREALAFWAAALDVGVARATPAAFPWTLANSPTGRISTALGITGPCATYVGEGALDEARLNAEADVAEGASTRALVVELAGLDEIGVAGGPTRVALSAWVVAGDH